MADSSSKTLLIHIDGASKGNPGPAGVGIVIADADGNSLARISSFIGEATNNQAEYRALIAALEYAAAMKAVHVTVRTDSQLVVEQINGNYKVRNRRLIPLHSRAVQLLSLFDSCSVDHIPRFLNVEADYLANTALKTRSH